MMIRTITVFTGFVLLAGSASAQPDIATTLDGAATKGIVVHLGCSDGGRTLQLHDDRFVVQGLDRNRAKVVGARKRIASAKKSGEVSVRQLHGNKLPYADNLLNMIVVDDTLGISNEEILRTLTPLGIAWMRDGDSWKKVVKPWPKDMDEWTHFLHDASGNAVSRDSAIGPPRRLQWTGGSLWGRSHEMNNSMPALVTAKGRMFYIFDKGVTGMEDERLPERWTLIARDAFNGSLLWQRPMTTWGTRAWRTRALRFFGGSIARRLVTDGDRVYVTFEYGKGVHILDAATGKTLNTIPGTVGAEEILVEGNHLFCVSQQVNAGKTKIRITCYDTNKNNVIWQAEDRAITPQLMSVSANHVVYHNRSEVVCLNRGDGSERWRYAEKKNSTKKKTRSKNYAMLLIADGKAILSSKNRIAALSLDDGKEVWTGPGAGGNSMRGYDLFVAQAQVWASSGDGTIVGYDVSNGKKVTKVDPSGVQSHGHHPRCYRAKATEDFLITQFRGVEFLSLDKSVPNNQNDWLRGTCTYGVMPANGFLYQPPHSCFCNAAAMQKGFNAFAGPSEDDGKPFVDKPGPIEKGPAYGFFDETKPSAKSWNSYRHDAQRTGATGNSVSAAKRQWKVNFAPGSDISPPVAANGRVFVAARSSHTIFAMDGATGKRLWQFTADARIDSPPSIYRGLLVFGCADGYAYCIRANDGELAWRRRLAPAERWISHEGQLESVWRLHGSVTVVGDLAYCVAGRSSFFDSGLFISAVDVITGEIKHRANLYTQSDTRIDREKNDFVAAYHIEGAHSDLLTAQGGFIYLNQMKFSPDLKLQPSKYLTKEEITKRKSMNLDNREFVNDDIFKVKWRNTTYENYNKLAGILVDEKQNVGERDTGLHLFTTSGFLDTTFFSRTFWCYSKTWTGFNMTNLAPKSGQLVVIGPKKTYALKGFTSRYPLSPSYNPDTKGYLLIADDNHNEPTMDPRAWGKDKGMGFGRGAPPIWHHWIPVRVKAMVLAGDSLIVCGPPDELKEGDVLSAFEGRSGSHLWTLSAKDGKITNKLKMDEVPAFDGMIVADDRLYITTEHGELICVSSE